MKRILESLFLLSLLIPQLLFAQWSSDPAQNNQISSGNDGTALPYVVTHPCGTSYISWFCPSSGLGEYYPFIQKVDASGYLQWTSPVLVSSNPSMTWITDYSLAVTPDTCALVTFQDMRTGNNDVFIYKIGQNGDLLWGDNGIQLSNNPAFEANPVMAVHPDGSVVVAWPRMPDNGDCKVVLQRINSAGQKTWASDLVLEESGYDYTWPKVIPVENGNTIVVYYKEWGYFSAPNRIIYAQKIDANGSDVWSAKPVLFNGVMPVYVHPQIAPDGNGGVFVTWMYERVANHLSSFVQHVSADGNVTMENNGAEVNTNSGTLALEPAIGCDETTRSAYIFWRETDLNQNVYGLYGQRMDVAGARKWGNNGIQIEPLGSQNAILPSVTPLEGGVIVGYEYDIFGGGGHQMIKACRLDSSGTKVWSGSTRTVSSALSAKGDLSCGPKQNSQIVYAWYDDRLGGSQIFAQNLCENGNFGPVDDSFDVNPDTLFFLTPDEVFNGKMFHIVNPHDYSLDIQYIQQQGTYPPGLIPWFTEPWNMTFPVTIAAGDSFGVTVKWPVLDDFGLLNLIYDTLHINTVNSAGYVIIVVDSTWIIMGNDKSDNVRYNLFPNPFKEKLNIDLKITGGIKMEIVVYNALMKPVRTLFDGCLQTGNYHLTWDGKDGSHNCVSPGVYLISITSPNGNQTLRVVRL
jgi:hypothetical protein